MAAGGQVRGRADGPDSQAQWLAIDLLTGIFADGIGLDYVCGDEVYGSCTQLREYLDERGQGYGCGSRRTSTSPWPAG